MRKEVLFFYFLFLLSAQNSISQTSDSLAYYFEEGVRLINSGLDFYFKGKLDSSISTLKTGKFYLEKTDKPDYIIRANFALMKVYNASGNFYEYGNLVFRNNDFATQNLPAKHQLYYLSINNVASYYFAIGNYLSAIDFYKKAFQLAKKNNNCIGEIIILRSLLASLIRTGNYHSAIDLSELIKQRLEGCDEDRKNQIDNWKGKLFLDIASLKNKLKSNNEALKLLQEAVLFLDKMDPKINKKTYYLLDANYKLATYLLEDLKVKEVEKLFPKIDSLENLSSRKRTQVKFEIMSDIESVKGNYDLAESHMLKSHKLRRIYFKKSPTHPRLIYSTNKLIKKHLDNRNIKEAMISIQRGLSLCSSQTSYSKYYESVPIWANKAQAHLARYQRDQNRTDLDSTLWCYLTADSLIDQARDLLQSEASKLFFSQKSRSIYERAIRFCMMMHNLTQDKKYLHKAFYFSERNKSTLLFQSLQDAGAKLAAGLPDSLLKKERDLKVDIAFYQNKIFETEQKASSADSARLVDWRQILFDREEAYRELIEAFEKEFPAYYRLKYEHQITSVEEVQQQLQQGQLFLEFFEGDSASYAFAIHEKGIQVVEIAKDILSDHMLENLLQQAREKQAGLAGFEAFTQASYAIYDHFLAPLLKHNSIEQLIIVPDGELSYLPFELLLTAPTEHQNLTDREAERAYRNLPYLFQRTQLRYAYSATLLFANPYRPQASIDQVAAFAPAYTDRWFLAHNQPQAEAVAALTDGKAFTEKDATKAQFIAQAPNYNILHLAMHGEPDLYSPLRAKLRFAGEDTAASSSLYAYELYNMKLNAQMAVLAACESGYGKLEQSEGIYSLARAFRYAGCPSVVSSLWKADGEATIMLMKAFYAALEAGKAKSEALQLARKQYLEKASNSQLHPYFWANFVVIGDDGAVSQAWSWWWVVGAICLLGGGYYLLRRRRQQ